MCDPSRLARRGRISIKEPQTKSGVSGMNLTSGLLLRPFLCSLGLVTLMPAVDAAEITVSVLDRKDQPVDHVAVYAQREDGVSEPAHSPVQAVMDQHDGHFSPHILVVETGTDIDFPNTDTVSHHVYSFSDAHPFELTLYKGEAHPTERFDSPGLVVLGCNIHDTMLGYILVVDTPHFALTGPDGVVTIRDLPPGKYSIRVWTPRARPNELPEPVALEVGDAAPGRLELQLPEKLFPPHASDDGSLTWAYY